MTLAHDLAAGVTTATPLRRGVPSGMESGVRYDDRELVAATINVAEIPEDEAGWRTEIETQTGITIPEDREVLLTGVRLWNMGPTQNRHLTFRIVSRSSERGTIDYEELSKLAQRHLRIKPPKPSELAAKRTRIIGLSDEQIGKVDRNGGTLEFHERLGVMLDKLDDEMWERPCEDAVILLGGDIIEGFQSHAGEGFMNDLSHPEQLDVARRYLVSTITRIAANFQRVRVLAVPSNHAAWRAGKGYLGKPGDDYGLGIVEAVHDVLAMNERWAHVEFIKPEPWEVSIAVTVRDDVLALTHGHVGNSSPASFDKWIDGQVSGDSPIASATIIVNGHWHHHLNQPIGNLGDRERRRIQLPALDGGSSQYTNARGDWSHPGIWTAIVSDGYGLDHERVLRAAF